MTQQYKLSAFCRYNNRTYRIDDIAWDHTPSNTFKRGDADMSFKNYYKSVGALKMHGVLYLRWLIAW